MVSLPRLALGAIQPEAETELVCWALLELLKRSGCQAQHFLSRCSFTPLSGAIIATGLASRHLDSWLMTADVCRELLVRGTGDSELAVVEGRYDICYSGSPPGGSLDDLCRRLELPRIVVIDVRRLECCHIPERPAADGLFLDGVRDSADACRWQTALESVWGIPVVASLEEPPRLRAAIRALPGGSALPRDLCEQLGAALEPYARLDLLQRIAASRPLPDAQSIAPADATQQPITVAVAYDQAFHCYFPDTLDLLEAAGASVVDFSPLHEEGLPPGTDVVYIGCGHPERHAHALAENHCMMSALRNHLCAGKRIYADGGGLAYLCQSLETPDIGSMPMLGALPAIARLNPAPVACRPVEATFARDNWLAPRGSQLRGYLSTRWQLEPMGQLAGMLQEPEHERDVVGCYQALASRLQVNFATQPGFVRTFFEPIAPRVAFDGVRVASS